VSQIFLETDRLVLRELQLSDEENLLDLDSDPEVMKYLTGGKPSTIKQVRASLGRVRAQLEETNGKYGVWATVEKKTNSFIGWFHLFPLKEMPVNPKKLYLGYRLKKKFWDQGYATEVSRELIRKSFAEYEAEEVCAHAMKDNIRSRNVMKKVGMTFRRKFKEKEFPVGFNDAVEYSILKDPSP
jgi:RimJ/RimL family protein N-acetyltransferase